MPSAGAARWMRAPGPGGRNLPAASLRRRAGDQWRPGRKRPFPPRRREPADTAGPPCLPPSEPPGAVIPRGRRPRLSRLTSLGSSGPPDAHNTRAAVRARRCPPTPQAACLCCWDTYPEGEQRRRGSCGGRREMARAGCRARGLAAERWHGLRCSEPRSPAPTAAAALRLQWSARRSPSSPTGGARRRGGAPGSPPPAPARRPGGREQRVLLGTPTRRDPYLRSSGERGL